MIKKAYILTVLMAVVLFTSCKKEQSLQGYLIETQEKKQFFRLDLSASLLSSYIQDNVSVEEKEAFNSIKKINIAFLPQNKASETEMKSEAKKIKEVMKNTDYKPLMRVNDKRGKGTIYYSGEADAIKEVIAVVYMKEFGVGVARVLGDKMNPGKMMEMLQKVKTEETGEGLVKIKDFFRKEMQTDTLMIAPKS
ncbi:DUF4252 domain-containing protein [Tenacibaculum sp. S7007]|uniref:DUF4252 domain-containing protein n=1 Tax=Tenacibaculum pelagium TaxID=2759527 RepID=A0A839AJ46_9FLAO|nr:DUF4252 domain-containing protein [Tenacibaculum pelagium]MBA6155172.1 DUF4252 domain-containing protein [Tenacibaculum pelagium]